MKNITFLFLFLPHFCVAQSPSLTDVIDQIDFKQDTIKSVYDWVTDNIKYDVEKLNAIKKGTKANNRSKYKSLAAYQNAELEKVIAKKKGVCQDYTLLFNAIVQELGYTSYIVTGYTKNKKGQIQRSIGHSWNAINDNGVWKLYEPTWGAGYVEDKKKFVKKYAEEWYDVNPAEMLKRHMPYDPIWQLSDNPISYQNFDDNSKVTKSKNKYNYQELIEAHFKKQSKEQMKGELERSKKMGDGMRLVHKWREHLSKSLAFYDLKNQHQLFNETNKKCKESMNMLNGYFAAKAQRFKGGGKWTIEYSKGVLSQIKEQMTSAKTIFKGAKTTDPKATRLYNKQVEQATKILKQIDSELEFISKLN